MVIMRIRRSESRLFRGHCLMFGGLLFVLTITALIDPCLAQTGEPAETIRVDSNLVDLQVSVISHDQSSPPTPLQQTDFAVLEDGVPQEIAFFAAADRPFDLVLLIDLSGSTGDKLKLIRRSARRFVEAARPLDRIAIVTFSDVVLVVSELTSNRNELRRAIGDIEKPVGGTRFWDALHFVVNVLSRPQPAPRRSAVVVMSDGVDNALPDVAGEGSVTTFDELLNVVKRSNTIIFPIYLDTEKEETRLHRTPKSAYPLARAQLAQLAEASGTVVYKANKLQDLESVYERVIRDLSTVYSIGYKPKSNSQDGKWHEVTLRVVNHPDLAAHTKSGYYAKALVADSPK